MASRTPVADRLTQFFEATTDAVFMLDRHWNFTYLNPNAQLRFGRNRNLLGTSFWDVFPEAKSTRTFALMYQALSEERLVEFETYSRQLSSWFDVRAYPWEKGLTVVFRDSSARVRQELTRREASERWRLASETAELGVWDANLVTGGMLWTPKFCQIVGLETSSQARAERFASLLGAEDRLDFEQMFRGVATGEVKSRMRAVYRVARASDGEPVWVLMRGLILLDEAGKPSRMIGTIQDVTDVKAVEDRARFASFSDVLTGLPSRNGFLDQVATMLEAAGTDHPAGLLAFDIEDFRSINETLGHDAGDDLLAEIGRRLGEHPEAGLAARTGAYEFAILMPDVSNDTDLMARADAFVDQISEPVEVEGRPVTLRLRVGMAYSANDGSDAKELMKRAETALHVARTSAASGPVQFTPSMHQPVIARVHQELLARQALTEDLIQPFYQPKIVLRTGAAAGFEALLRWMDPKRGLQTPDSIFAAFSHPSLASEIGRRMLEKVLTDLRHWRDTGIAVDNVSVNLTELELKRADFVEHFLSTLQSFAVPASSIQVEVTEPVLLGKDAYVVTTALQALRKEGIKVALDDFGVGFTSLTLLREHPIDVLKIDRSFTRELGRNKDALAVARAAIKLGQDLGKVVIAVGLSTADQRDLVAATGCDMGQGFLLGRPMSATEVPEFLGEKAEEIEAEVFGSSRGRRAII